MRISAKSATLLAITSMLLTALPAEARPRWGGPSAWRGGGSYGSIYSRPRTYYRQSYPRYYGGYSSYYGGYSSYYGGNYGRNDGLTVAVGAGILGLMLGSALSSRNRGYSRGNGDRPGGEYYEGNSYPGDYDRYESRGYGRDSDRSYDRPEQRGYQQDLARVFRRSEGRGSQQDYARNSGRSEQRSYRQDNVQTPVLDFDRYDRGDYTARYYDKSGNYDPDRYYREGGDGSEPTATLPSQDDGSLDTQTELDKEYGAVGM